MQFIGQDNSKDILLGVAKNQAELLSMQQVLEYKGFRYAATAVDALNALVHKEHVFMVLTRDLSKDLYDVIAQYPTGQVQLFDTKQMQNSVVTPPYTSVFVLLTTEDTLDHIQQSALPIQPEGVQIWKS